MDWVATSNLSRVNLIRWKLRTRSKTKNVKREMPLKERSERAYSSKFDLQNSGWTGELSVQLRCKSEVKIHATARVDLKP